MNLFRMQGKATQPYSLRSENKATIKQELIPMPLVPMKQILDEAAKGGYGVPHFNINNMEQAQAIMRAADEVKSPVIMAASRGALKYSDLVYLKHIMFASA